MSRLHRLFAVLGLLFLAAPAMAQEPQAGPSEAYLAAAADLRAEIDRTAFDLDALSLDLAIAEPAEIAEALDARMRTEIYAGVLRGGAGALASGAGNPWDQALALTQVLTEAGYETRIAHAELDEATARALIAAATPRTPQPVAAGPGAEAALDRMAEAGSAEALAPVRELFARGLPVPAMPEEAPAQAARIAEALGEAAPDGTALDALMLREAADYIWVQSRLSALEDWTDLHLAFTPPGPLTPTSFIDSPIPDAHVHRLEIGLELERREGDRLRRADLMRSQRFPVANLGREAISLAIVPDGGGEGTLAERAAAASFFYPLMNGELAPDARAFTRQGMTVDAGDIAAGMGAGQLFATVGGKLGGALGALGAMSGDEKEAATAAPEATALVLTVRYDPPEGFGERQVVERRIVDRIGAEARSGKNLATLADAPELVGRWALQILPGGIDAAELADRQLARLIETGGAPDATPENPAETATLATYFQAAAEGGAGPDALAYRAEPFIAATTMTPADEGRAVGMDILRTGLRVLKRDGESWRADPAGAMRAGVAETLLESALLDGAAATGFEPQRKGAWATLTSTPDLRPASGRNGLKTLDPPAASVEAASGDLARGALIVMAADGSAWWRVDPQSGAALGIDSLGRGGETAEYMMLVDAAITIGFEVYGAYQCAAAGGPQFCCQATNIVWSVVGFGILGAIGEAVVALKWMDEVLAASMGISVGAHAGVLGAGGVIPNPFQSLCK